MEKGKCIFCGRKINPTTLRCPTCNEAWNEGWKSGEEKIKGELRHMINTVKNLLNERKP